MTRAALADRLQQMAALSRGVMAAVDEAGKDGGSHAELWLYGVVGGYYFGFNDKTVADTLRGLDVDHITVRINSPGGSAFQGLAIANLLRSHKARVKVVVDGIAASAASIIAIAGDEVIMSPGSQMMIHDAWMVVAGNEKELRQEADWIGKQSANLADQYVLKAGGTADAWRAAMTAEPDGTWYFAAEAVAAKLADSVGNVAASSPAPEPPAPDLDDDEDLEAHWAAWSLDALSIHPRAMKAWTGNATPKPPAAPAPGSVTPQEGSTAVAFSPEQLTQMRDDLGLPADADEATILAAVSESAKAKPSTAPEIPEGMTLIETDVLQKIQSGSEAGEKALEQQRVEKRDATIAKAITDGKITPARADHFKTLYDADKDGTVELLGKLQAGTVPVDERGHDKPAAEDTTATINDASIDAFAGSLGLTKEDLRG